MNSENKLSLGALTSLVVGSMIGAGIFTLPSSFGRATGGFGALIAWAIAGTGMLTLAFVFQTLAQRKPELDSGIYAYAKAGFGNYMGFASALGFWAGTCIGNVSYFILIKSTLSLIPGTEEFFGDGNTLGSIAISSVILWFFHILILRGVKQAATINTIATVAKIVPIFIFVIALIFVFDTKTFMLNFWGNPTETLAAMTDTELLKYGFLGHAEYLVAQETVQAESLFTQVRSTMLITVFVFLGIEGASIYSRYAKKREHVGIATVLGFIGVLCLLIMVTMLSYGVMLRPELAALRQPAMANVLAAAVGPWGATLISVGLIISVLGAYLSWSLLAAEVLYVAAKHNTMPSFLAKLNDNNVPSSAVWLTNIFIQLFLVTTYFTQYAFRLALELTSSLTLIPYFLVAAYSLKLALTKETYETNSSNLTKDLVIAFIASAYALLMIYAGGLKYILLSAIIYGPCTFLYFKARREQGKTVFTPIEGLIFGIVAVGAVIAVYSIVTGSIEI